MNVVLLEPEIPPNTGNIARLCAATGADVQQVVNGMGHDRRIGRAFLSPGPGFGGERIHEGRGRNERSTFNA